MYADIFGERYCCILCSRSEFSLVGAKHIGESCLKCFQRCENASGLDSSKGKVNVSSPCNDVVYTKSGNTYGRIKCTTCSKHIFIDISEKLTKVYTIYG